MNDDKQSDNVVQPNVAMVMRVITEDDTMSETSITSENENTPQNVIATGYGLSTGLSGQPNIFMLDARHAGFGDFDVVIKGASRATIEYLEEDDALYKIKYFVSLPGNYQIEIKYDQLHIPGSPFLTKVMEQSWKENAKVELGSTSPATASMESFSTLNYVSEDDNVSVISSLPIEASVVSPSGLEVIGHIIEQPNGKVSVKFPREEVGEYTVTIMNTKTKVILPGSPFKVVISSEQQCRTTVKSDSTLKKARVNGTNCFSLIAPNGIKMQDLCIAVIGMTGIKLRLVQNDTNSIDIIYDIKRVGTYMFHVHENGTDIAGSPFDVNATNLSLDKTQIPRYTASVTATLWHGDDVIENTVTTEVKSPKGDCLAHSVIRRGRHLLELRFLPKMTGQHCIMINFHRETNGHHAFNLDITNYPSDQELFQVKGEGTKTAIINHPTEVSIVSLLPVSRSFTVEFDGPSKVDIEQNQLNNDGGEYRVNYTCHSVGNYLMSLKYDGFHVANSPYRVHVCKSNELIDKVTGDDNSCYAYGEGLYAAVAGEASHFSVDALNAGSGALMAGLDENSSTSEVVCKHIKNCVYDVEYRIEEKGRYKMNVIWAGAHINGSPFTICVTDPNNNT